ncbi:MAG: helix-turn-helix domain-containing protein, partial [bacterium]
MQIKYLLEGMQPAKIARRFGVCRQTVYNHLDRGLEEPFPKPRARRPARRHEAPDTGDRPAQEPSAALRAGVRGERGPGSASRPHRYCQPQLLESPQVASFSVYS